MAILERLRVRAGLLLAIVIGLALLAFVLGDFLNSGGSLFTRSKFEIAEVAGKSIPYTDYEDRVRELEDIQKLQSGQASLDENTTDQIRSVTWENMIQDLLLEKQYAKVGIDVSQEELTNMIMGEHPHPAIAQLFTDPQTGIFNRQAFLSFMQRIENEDLTDEKKYYLFIENEIFRQRKNAKYMNLIKKGLYATSLEAKIRQEQSVRTIDLDYVVQNFNTIPDSAISVTENDLKKYYSENINQYKQEESRDIRYVYFQVKPSETDYKAAEQWINDILPEFEATDNIPQFVNMESDEPFDEKNYNAGELPDTLNDALFNAPLGTTYGPYFRDNSYRISRLAAIHYLPDSVKARHILLRAGQDNAQKIFNLADSLKNLITHGEDFGRLALLYSADGSAQNGGDLGWFREGDMVKSFSDSCFYGKKGDVKLVATQYGLHVVQILDQSRPVKQVQVGTVVKNVTPSDATDQVYYLKANEFAGLNNTAVKFNSAIEADNLAAYTQVALKLDPMEKRIPGLESARPLVSWIYKAEKNDVSTVFKFGDKYVVAVLDKIREKGHIPLADIKAEIENAVMQQKKAEKITALINEKRGDARTIEDVAANLGLQVQPVSGIRFTSSSLGNAGMEPQVIASACALQKGKISNPIVGENGVYVLSVNNVNEPSGENQVALNQARVYIERNFGARTNYFAYEALKDLAAIKDNRREFY
jgi:peptidyl-prolyl cis-trans isomerase D